MCVSGVRENEVRDRLEEPVAKTRTTADAVRLHVLRSFKCVFGSKTNFASHEIIERVVGVYACGVGVEATAIDFDGDVEAQHFFPFRILSVFFGLIGISGIRANALADELIGGVAFQIFIARNECLFALGTFHHADREVELRQEIGRSRVLRWLSRDEIWTIGNENILKVMGLSLQRKFDGKGFVDTDNTTLDFEVKPATLSRKPVTTDKPAK